MSFELNNHCGWTKFIVVVPRVAIREGVKKSFDVTVDHFMEQYGKKARYFIYYSCSIVLCRPMHQIIIFYKWSSENRFFFNQAIAWS